MRKCLCLVWLALLFAACETSSSSVALQIVRVQYTFATRPWLADIYACGSELPGIVIQVEQRPSSSLDPLSADVTLRLGVPPRLNLPTYILGEEEIKIVVSSENPVTNLRIEQAAGLFSGRVRNWKGVGGADLPVQLWTFVESEDIQQDFNAAILSGGAVSPLTRQVYSTEEMEAGVASDATAIGILPGRLLSGNLREIQVEGSEGLILPVLAIVREEPQGTLRELLACLQE